MHKAVRHYHYLHLRAQMAGAGTYVLTPVTHSYRWSGTVNGIPTTFVVDTGASDYWEKVNRGHCSLELRRQVGVEGIPLHVCGVAKLELKLAGEILHSPSWLLDP